jgi:hypothetical protein
MDEDGRSAGGCGISWQDWWDFLTDGKGPYSEVETMKKKHRIKKLERTVHKCLEEVREVLGKEAAEAFALAWVRNLAAATGISKLPLIMEELLRSAGLGGPYRTSAERAEEDEEDERHFREARLERERREQANRWCADELIKRWCATELLGRKIMLNRLDELGEKFERSGRKDDHEAAEACRRAAALLHGLSTRALLYASDVVPLLARLAKEKTVAEVIPKGWQGLVTAELEAQRKAPPETWRGWWIDTIGELVESRFDYERNRVSADVLPPKELPAEQHGEFMAIDVGVRQWGDSAHVAHLRAIRISKSCLFVKGDGPKAMVYEATDAFPMSKLQATDLCGEDAGNWVVGDGCVGLTMHYLGTVSALATEHQDKEAYGDEINDEEGG